MTIRYLSLFSGIEAATQAWKPLGWECVGFSEIERFPSKVLATRHPGVPNFGDVTKITEMDIAALGAIDLVVFGSPCQDLSIAGKRKGLDGARSGLFFAAMDIVGWARTWCGCRGALWENVPGAFTSNKGQDFAVVVRAMGGGGDEGVVEVPPKGWGNEGVYLGREALVEWSTLDAQWFGVAQRRRRVFAFADFGDWAGRPPVLLEREGLRGDSAPSRGPGETVAPTLAAGANGGGPNGPGRDADTAESLVVEPRSVLTTRDVAHCLNAGGMGRIDYETETMLVAYMPSRSFGPDGGVDERFAERNVCDALHTKSGAGNKAPIIAFNSNAQPFQMSFDEHTAASLTCSQNSAVMTNELGVRRLTPRECERLQGMADDYTALGADGPRYKALGNSMAVPVMQWIGRQIDFAWRLF